MTSAWGRLGTMERISVGLPQLDTSPPALYTAPLNNTASTSSDFQGTGYGTSSSSLRILFMLVPHIFESMFDDICSSVVHRQSLLLDITPHSIQPSYLRPSSLPYISISFFPRSALLFSPYARTSYAPYIDFYCDFSHFRCIYPLILHF